MHIRPVAIGASKELQEILENISRAKDANPRSLEFLKNAKSKAVQEFAVGFVDCWAKGLDEYRNTDFMCSESVDAETAKAMFRFFVPEGYNFFEPDDFDEVVDLVESFGGAKYVLAETGHFMNLETPQLFVDTLVPFFRDNP